MIETLLTVPVLHPLELEMPKKKEKKLKVACMYERYIWKIKREEPGVGVEGKENG